MIVLWWCWLWLWSGAAEAAQDFKLVRVSSFHRAAGSNSSSGFPSYCCLGKCHHHFGNRHNNFGFCFHLYPPHQIRLKEEEKHEPGRRKCPLNMCLHFIFLEFRCLFKSYIWMYILKSNYNKLVVSTSNVWFPEIDQSNHNIHGIHLCFFFSGRSI